MPSQRSKDLAIRHMGIIAQRCRYWWVRMPPRVRVWYELDDMIGDVVLHVFSVSHKYDPSVAKDSTFVYHVADNYCLKLLGWHQRQQRGWIQTVMESGEIGYSSVETSMPEGVQERCHDTVNPSKWEISETRHAIESVIANASTAALDLIDQYLTGTLPRRLPSTAVEQLREAVQGKASAADFRRARKCFA
jgi:hypothetical protein